MAHNIEEQYEHINNSVSEAVYDFLKNHETLKRDSANYVRRRSGGENERK